MTEPNYYKILQISPAAQLPEIRQAYRRRVRDTHPDAGGDPEQFHAIQEAYEILSNATRRLEYDTEHGHKRLVKRGPRTPGRHAKTRKVKAWRVKTSVAEPKTTRTSDTEDIAARPWFIDINPQKRLRHNPSIWLRTAATTGIVATWLIVGVSLITAVEATQAAPAVRALVIPYALAITAASAIASFHTMRPIRPATAAVALAAAIAAIWSIDGASGILLGLHLALSILMAWCVRRLRHTIRLRAAVRSALREYNAFGPAGTRPSADRRTGAVLRTLLERIPSARLFVRVPVGPHRAEYTVVCGKRVAVITPPLPRTSTDTGAEQLPYAVNDVSQLLLGTQVRGYVVWPSPPIDQLSGTDAIIRHVASHDAASEIGRWLADEPYTLHLPTLRRLRDRLAGGDNAMSPRTSDNAVSV
ncbi:MAG TPA: J domain-containing protein [Candidatus Stackebrandtia faecavium]|nr:J domain-containing protein [Candidatus Stackebrandtia faecavium]